MDVRLAVADALLADAASLRRLAHGLLAGDEADDAVQETCLAALSRPASVLRHPGLWLRGTLHKLAIRARRSKARRLTREQLAAKSEVDPRDPETLAMQAEVVRDVGIAVHALEEPFRSAVLLRFWHDLPVDAIAARLGVPRNTVRSRLQRGLARLRERLDREHGARERWSAPLGAFLPLRVPAVAAGLLLTALVMKTKLLLGATAILLAAVAIPFLLDQPATADAPVTAKDNAVVVAPPPTAAVREEAPEPTVAKAAEVTPPPFDPAPVRVEPWLARFQVVDQKQRLVADATITMWRAQKVPGHEMAARLGKAVSHSYRGRHGEPLFTLRSDAEGRASVQLDEECYVVIAAGDGFVGGSEWPLYAATAGTRETRLVLKVPLQVRGVVLRVDGSPASQATVKIRTPSISRFTSTVVAGDDGRFEAAVPEDYYDLTAELDGARTLEERIDLRRREADEVTLRFPGAFTLAGQVIDADGQPVAGALVCSWREFHPDPTLRTRPQDERGRASSGADGRFTIPVRKLARYQLVASTDGCGNSELIWTETTAAEPHPFTRMQLQAFTTITGRVRSEKGQPLAGRKVFALPETDLTPARGSTPASSEVFANCKPASADQDGRFEVRVQAGVAWHLFTCSTGSFTMRIGSLRNVKPGTTSVELVVPDAMLVPSRVRGSVVRASDGSPVMDCKVWLAHLEGDHRPSFNMCQPEWHGHEFVLPDLPSGCRYLLQVQPDVMLLEKTDWAAVRVDAFTTSATTAVELKMRVPLWGELPLRVVPADGDDLDGFSCGISLDIVQNAGRSAQSLDHEGRARIKRVPPGVYQVHVMNKLYERVGQQEVLVGPGPNPEVVVNLPKQAK